MCHRFCPGVTNTFVQIRTIVFRFTSIGEAVSFKSMLIRNEDWEGCNIQFAVDPCEKATAVHLE
jgi:hypothetical protein